MTQFLPDLTAFLILIAISLTLLSGKERVTVPLCMIITYITIGVIGEAYSEYKFYKGNVTFTEALKATVSNHPAGNSLYPHNFEELVPHKDLESKYGALECPSQLTSIREYDLFMEPKDPNQIIMGESKAFDSLTCCHSTSNFGVPYQQDGEDLLLRCGDFPKAYIVKVNGSNYSDLTRRD
ncbi:hypothetical protein [Vibrio sp. 10N.239.312.D08]|uniref:hypothetical protein n=1 Tax=Vibrio sp. 10N.239.312.D08 TaxID=3229978 RepID=UPI0035514D8B